MVNSLYFTALKNIPSPYYSNGTHLFRLIAKTGSLYDNIMTCEMVFKYTDDTNTFDLSGNRYMTLFHLGSSASSHGFAICLKKVNTNNIQICVRYTDGSTWHDLNNSFYQISNDPNIKTYFMFQYNLTGNNNQPKLLNFYVVNIDSTIKTTPDFIYELTESTNPAAPHISPSAEWGFGSVCDNINSTGDNTDINEGYVSTNGYNSYISQNVELFNARTWNRIIKHDASNNDYSIFNTNASYSLYNFIKNESNIPQNISNLNFQLLIPSYSTNLATLQNTAILNDPSGTYVSLTNNENNIQHLDPQISSYHFGINDANYLNIMATSSLACIAKGSFIRTPNGEVLIENLKIGDFILTHDNRPTRIKKIMHYNQIINENTKPVLIRKGMYNANKDFYLSRNHGILINGEYIVPAKYLNLELYNLGHIIIYYLIMTENFFKDTMVANGVTVETWGGYNPLTDTHEDIFIKDNHKLHETDFEVNGIVRHVRRLD